jgi:hypothetical protein
MNIRHPTYEYYSKTVQEKFQRGIQFHLLQIISELQIQAEVSSRKGFFAPRDHDAGRPGELRRLGRGDTSRQ